ncbi:putative ribonuclease H-like domain-containing protein [Tanacetum coccineum]
MTQTVPSKSTANVTYQGTARSRVPQAVLSRSTDGSYYPRMDNRRPRISSYSPSSRSSTTRTPHRPQRPKKVVKLIWVKKGSTVGSQAVLPQTVKKSAMISPKQTWKPKGNYLDSVNRGNGSYTLKQFEYGNPEEDLKDYAGDNHDRRSTSGGCQYLGRRLVSWQCKKQTIVAISSTDYDVGHGGVEMTLDDGGGCHGGEEVIGVGTSVVMMATWKGRAIGGVAATVKGWQRRVLMGIG